MGDSEKLKMLQDKRDKLIKQLWLVFCEMLDVGGSDNFTEEDLNLWTRVTSHSGFQQFKHGTGGRND